VALQATRIYPGGGERTNDARADVVRWVVPTRFQQAAYEAEGIPQNDGDPHPDDPKLKLDRRTADTDGANTEITGYYSTDGRYKGGTVRLSKTEGWYKWAPLQTRKVDIDIPYSALEWETIEAVGDVPARTFTVWKGKVLSRTHRFPLRRLDVFTKVLNRAALDLPATMMDHLHTIRGSILRFEGMTNYQEAGDNFYTLTYEWSEDPGTRWPEPRTSRNVVFLSPDNYPSDAVFLRFPYETLVHTRSEDPENIPIPCVGIGYPPDLRRPSEWRALPGMPPL